MFTPQPVQKSSLYQWVVFRLFRQASCAPAGYNVSNNVVISPTDQLLVLVQSEVCAPPLVGLHQLPLACCKPLRLKESRRSATSATSKRLSTVCSHELTQGFPTGTKLS